MNERAAERGVKLRYEKGERWEIKQLLYAGDRAVLKPETGKHLQHNVNGAEN